MVIIDRADVLDRESQTAFFRALMGFTGTYLVLLTARSQSAIPNLNGTQHGYTYWIERGQCAPLPQAPPPTK